MKNFFSLLRQTVIISLITFGLTEIAFRIYHKINPSFMFYDPSSYNRWRGKPLSTDYGFQLNSRGFKDVEFTKQKAEGTYRIIGIGDSFAYSGVPYKHNFLTLLESKLNQDTQQPIELINMGIIAIGPKDYLSLFVNEGLELNPDMLLLSFYIGNDFSDNYKSQEDRRLLKVQDSYVLSFFDFLIKVNSNFQGNLYHHGIEYQEDLPTSPDDFHLQEAKKRSYIFIKDWEKTDFPEHFKDAFGDLLKIKEICDSRNITLVVVFMPDEVQVIQQLREKVIGSYNFSPEQFDFRQPNKLLSQELDKHNIYHLDIVEEFVAAGSETALYKPNDIHWNIAGNRLAAEVIDKYLSQKFFP